LTTHTLSQTAEVKNAVATGEDLKNKRDNYEKRMAPQMHGS